MGLHAWEKKVGWMEWLDQEWIPLKAVIIRIIGLKADCYIYSWDNCLQDVSCQVVTYSSGYIYALLIIKERFEKKGKEFEAQV